MTSNLDVMEEIRMMREKLYGKKPITHPALKENGTRYKSPYIAMWANKNNK